MSSRIQTLESNYSELESSMKFINEQYEERRIENVETVRRICENEKKIQEAEHKERTLGKRVDNVFSDARTEQSKMAAEVTDLQWHQCRTV